MLLSSSPSRMGIYACDPPDNTLPEKVGEREGATVEDKLSGESG